MHVGESGKVAVLHGFLVLAIHAVHLLAGEVESERLDEGREDARLDELVIDHLRLGRLATVVRLRRITVGKLTADRAVADRNRRRTSHDRTGLLDHVCPGGVSWMFLERAQATGNSLARM